MIVANQQANIKNVNGALADILANRPAAQSTFYLFYSTDTQEIYYDNGSWILLAAAGGTPVNIYNSDGTLTGNRTLSGGNFDLNFADLNLFKTNISGNDIGLNLDFASSIYQLGQLTGGNQIFFNISDTTQEVYLSNGGSLDGLITDFNFRTFEFGSGVAFNGTRLKIDDTNQISQFYGGSGLNGAEFDFGNSIYKYGILTSGIDQFLYIGTDLIQTINNSATQGIRIDYSINAYEFGDGSTGNQQNIVNYSGNSVIKTTFSGNDIGLKLDFANQQYIFGNVVNSYGYIQDDINGLIKIGDPLGNFGGYNNLNIDYSNSVIYTQSGGNDIGLKLDFANAIYSFGDLLNFQASLIQINVWDIYLKGQNNNTYFILDDGNQTIKTQSGGSDIGLKLDFANNQYYYGDFTNLSIGFYLLITNGGNVLNSNLQNSFIVNDNINFTSIDQYNNQIGTIYNGNQLGLSLNFASQIYTLGNGINNFGIKVDESFGRVAALGDWNVTNNGSYVYLDDVNKNLFLVTGSGGGNATSILISDTDPYPYQFDGANIVSATSGGNSGNHLKVKINGTDYKIKLENP